MKTLLTQRKMAAKVLGVGLNRVWFDPNRLDEIKEAITKEDIRALIKEGVIKKRPIKGIKRRAGKIRQLRKRKGRRRRAGKRKKTIVLRKRNYIIRIRNLRKYIARLKKEGKIDSKLSKKLRRWAKSGLIKSKREIDEKIELIKKGLMKI